MNKYILVVFLLISTLSCKEEYPLELDKNESLLVVDACITNTKGPHFVRLSKSFTQVKNRIHTNYGDIVDEPVKDALVIIKDDMGTVDTLSLLDDKFLNNYYDDYNYPDYIYTSDDFIRNYYYTIEQNSGKIDTVVIRPSDYDLERNAIYKTNKIQGLPGGTYTIDIKWKDKVYSAKESMTPALKIDSTGYRYEKALPGKNGHYVPLIYFKNPSASHPYYLTNIQSRQELDYLTCLSVWYYSIFITEYFTEYVNGIFLEDGYDSDWWRNNYYARREYIDGKSQYFFSIKISSLSKGAYVYYKQLSESLGQDGGAYKPSPASAPGNISNGALGYFRVSANTNLKIPIEDYDDNR